MTLRARPGGAAQFATTAVKRGARGVTQSTIIYFHNKPGWSPIYRQTTPPAVRCDNARPGLPGVGCVIKNFTPVMVYDLTGRYPTLARHLRDAQGSGLPGAYPRGAVLNRTTPALAEKNRTRACPSTFPRPDKSRTCDEYPPASTAQGAFTANPGALPRNLRRTFPWCKLRAEAGIPYRRGPKGYSICMINWRHNRDGGNALAQFYDAKRILPPVRADKPSTKGDAFRIRIR